MTLVPRAGRVPALLIAALVVVAALVACSGGGSGDGTGYGAPTEPSAASGTPSPAESDEPAPLEVPAGVSPTAAGAELSYGDTATLAWPLSGDEVGVLDLRVDGVREVPQRDFRGWLAGEALEQSRPYYVDVRVRNVGESDLGGQDVPLYLLDTNGTLGPPWAFDGKFNPCASGPLPRAFAPGDRTRACLVFLAPQKAVIDAMAFAPSAEVEPITWTGDVATPRDGAQKKDAQQKDAQKKDESGNRAKRRR